jgi:hypothetical protein
MRSGGQESTSDHERTLAGEQVKIRRAREKLSMRAKEQEQDVHGSSIIDFAVL